MSMDTSNRMLMRHKPVRKRLSTRQFDKLWEAEDLARELLDAADHWDSDVCSMPCFLGWSGGETMYYFTATEWVVETLNQIVTLAPHRFYVSEYSPVQLEDIKPDGEVYGLMFSCGINIIRLEDGIADMRGALSNYENIYKLMHIPQ